MTLCPKFRQESIVHLSRHCSIPCYGAGHFLCGRPSHTGNPKGMDISTLFDGLSTFFDTVQILSMAHLGPFWYLRTSTRWYPLSWFIEFPLTIDITWYHHRINPRLIAGWWFQPLWNIWVRQLGWWHSIPKSPWRVMCQNSMVPVTTKSDITTNHQPWINWTCLS